MFGGRTAARLSGANAVGGAANGSTAMGGASGPIGGETANSQAVAGANQTNQASGTATGADTAGAVPSGAEESGIRAYYDLGVPAQRPGGIAGGIANGQVGSIGGGVANSQSGGAGGNLANEGVSSLGGDIGQPDGLDFTVEFPPDESGIADTGDSANVPTGEESVPDGGVANSTLVGGAAAGFPPDESETAVQPSTGGSRFNGRTAAGFRGLNPNYGTSGARFNGGNGAPGSRFETRRNSFGTPATRKANGGSERSLDRLNQRFGDDF